MNILAMAIANTFNSQRKYLRWHLKVLAFFTGVIDKKSILLDTTYVYSHKSYHPSYFSKETC